MTPLLTESGALRALHEKQAAAERRRFAAERRRLARQLFVTACVDRPPGCAILIIAAGACVALFFAAWAIGSVLIAIHRHLLNI